MPRERHQDARNLTPHRVAKRISRPAMARQLQLRGSAVAPLVEAGCEQRASLGVRARGCFSLQARRSSRTPLGRFRRRRPVRAAFDGAAAANPRCAGEHCAEEALQRHRRCRPGFRCLAPSSRLFEFLILSLIAALPRKACWIRAPPRRSRPGEFGAQGRLCEASAGSASARDNAPLLGRRSTRHGPRPRGDDAAMTDSFTESVEHFGTARIPMSTGSDKELR